MPAPSDEERTVWDLIGLTSWTRADLLALVGAVAGVAAVVVALVPSIRNGLIGLVKVGSLRTGRSERRYASWFIKQWGKYDNPYLDDTENLDLSNTYVSLSLRPPGSDQETRKAAAEVLGDRDGGNLVIEGDPGSGKSTLLKAYGVGALKVGHGPLRRRAVRGGDVPVPFVVQLRKLARRLSPDFGLAQYLCDDLLVSGAGMSPQEATEFLGHVLAKRRALVMLDGLDEVTAEYHATVLEAVYTFIGDADPQLPTREARVVVTCRRQNFIALRDQWVPAVAGAVSTLIPLRNSEIFAYLDKLRDKFKAAGGGPEAFFNAVRGSGTLDLHRTPLILAMSVGIFARKDFYDIPNSIAKLYRTMIEEMLDRQRFKYDPGGAAVRLPVADKYRFLREFALARALGVGGFDDFSRDELVDFARALAPSLRAVDDPSVLVAEVADRSGLVNDVSEEGHFVFAHRSLHEHLVAEELLSLPDGELTLLDHAADPEWRQVVLFAAAALEQRRADDFFPRLALRNVTLAGHCLAGAVPSDSVAEPILDALQGDTSGMTALIAATTSPRKPVQEMAVSRLEDQMFTSMRAVHEAIHGDVEGMLPLLGALAGSNAARIAALVPGIVAAVPDDPRLVEPLWRCLTVPEIEKDPACRVIVERLLVIAMDVDGFDALQRQEPYSRDFLDEAVRRRAYPFEKGLPRSCNLVTLLAWAQYLDVVPTDRNRFFEAKVAGRLSRVEADKRMTIGFSLFWPARILSVVAAVGSVVALVLVLIIDWRLLLRPLGWWTPVVGLVLGAAALGVMFLLAKWGRDARDGTLRSRLLSTPGDENIAHFVVLVGPESDRAVVLLFGLPIVYALTFPAAFTAVSSTFTTAGFAVPLVLFWMTLFRLFSRDLRFYPYRPNEFIDMYRDRRSSPWLMRELPDDPT
jgi:hypothetical protein